MTIEKIRQVWLKGQFKLKDRFEFYDMLGLLLDNDVIQKTALEKMYLVFSNHGQKTRNIIATVCQECVIAISDGKSLSEALLPWVSYDEFSLIQAGEKAGAVQESFTKAKRLLDSKKKVMKAIATMTIYPSFLILMAVYLLRKIALDLVPKLGRGSNPDTWNAPAQALKMIADYVTNYGLITALGLVGFTIAVLVSMPLLRGRLRFYLDKVPPYSIYQMLYGSTFLLNVGVLLSAGVHLKTILETMTERANPWLKERLDDALHGVNIGANLGEALHNAGHDFPDKRAVQILRIISDQSGGEKNLEAFGERWMEESVTNLGKASNMILAGAMALNGGLMLLVLVGASGMSDALINGMRQ